MNEEWKKVPYEELSHYEVSTFGNVRSLDRVIKTRIVNHGKEMYVMSHHKGRNVAVQYENNRPLIRLLGTDGKRRKFSLPLLMLKMFKSDLCPGEIDYYTAGFIDGDTHNNHIDNLMWISKGDLMANVSSGMSGVEKEYLKKYKYIIIKVDNQVVGYAENTTSCAELFRSYGIDTSVSSIGRSIKECRPFYFMFDLILYSEDGYKKVAEEHNQMNLKSIYNIVMEERRTHKRLPPITKIVYRKSKVKTVKVPKEKVVYKTKEVPVIKEKIVYRDKIVKVKDEKVKEEKKVLANDSTTNVKVSKEKEVKATDAKRNEFLDRMKIMLGVDDDE